ncbi:hypothetical protein [Larkinella terrae]|uniref:Uncharacterized protein n=1 Tax=Larkinella terrae TaxID=2025311 RepID=A0A7K0EIM4_9BACT|nr:hypothetical protein [Larkinella terrae]MRS61657.1 hypothetical protein [Larkinella terrae]
MTLSGFRFKVYRVSFLQIAGIRDLLQRIFRPVIDQKPSILERFGPFTTAGLSLFTRQPEVRPSIPLLQDGQPGCPVFLRQVSSPQFQTFQRES